MRLNSTKVARIFVVVLIVAISYHLLISTDPLHSSDKVRETENRKDQLKYNKSVNYLWRPNSVEAPAGSVAEVSSDRIGAQLKWTKNFIEKKVVGKGKSILLVYGVRGSQGDQIWKTYNNINCPGFSIKSEQCKLSISQDLREGNLSLDRFDAIIYTPDFKPSENSAELVQDLHIPEIIYKEETPNSLQYTLAGRNLLATYYRGSDIATPYGKWVPFDDENVEYFGVTRNTSKTDFTAPMDYAAGKTHFAVMFVSNCYVVKNDRLKYAHELQKYIPVDIFGDCGVEPPCNESNSKECLNEVVRKYKFYLAFENCNCRDYITEKFYDNALKNDVLPVVLGAHPDDYRYAAPPNSYINVEDFESPKHLAQFLLRLDKNNTMYNEYFRWKGTGEFYDAWRDLFCRL